MLDAGIIEHVEESEWICPIVIHDKKTTCEVRIDVDLRKLNDACLHDPFPTPFTNEVLESIVGQELYSFTDGFFGYHQVRIAVGMPQFAKQFNVPGCLLIENAWYEFNEQ